MLQNKLKIIIILTTLIFTFMLPTVRAENETAINTTQTPNTQTVLDPATPVQEENTTTDENFKQGDVYLTGDNITIDYVIDGNVFIFANTVTINSQIGGDAFICANSVTIGSSAYIFSNLFTFSKNVQIDGIVCDLYCATQNTTINGTIYRDIRVGSNTVTISGIIGRNASINCNTLTFPQDTNDVTQNNTNLPSKKGIHGNLNYSSPQEASIPNDFVKGETTFKQENSSPNPSIGDRIFSLITFITTVIMIWLISLWLVPNFLKNATCLLTTKKVLPVIGFGVLTPIVSILLAILLFMIGITSTLAFILLLTLLLLMLISTSLFIIHISYIVCDKLNIQKTFSKLGILVLCTTILWLVGFIPYIGLLIGILAIILGFGTIITNLVFKEKEKKTN